jgi:FkbM family methyltransferase
MSSLNRLIHRVVIGLGAEEFFVKLRRHANFFRRFVPVRFRHKFGSVGKFVPASSSYPKDDRYLLTRENTSFRINRSDYVQWRIFYGVRDNALQYAKKCLKSNSIVLDIGANCGAFSLKLATHAIQQSYTNLHIHAFEPNPLIFKNYTDNLALNPPIEKIVHAHAVGLGSENGERSFHYPDTNTGVGRVMQKDSAGEFTVKLQRLDDFVDNLNPPDISFIKMIVEGFEPEVLKGGWNTLKRFKPPIFLEATDEWYRENNSSVAEVVQELRALGYQFRGEYFNEIIPYEESKFSKLYQFNLLADVDFRS